MITANLYIVTHILNQEKPAEIFFFSKISPIADQVAKHLGISLRYFGTFHLELENGHVWKSEGVFEKIVLEDNDYKKMTELSYRMFCIFKGIHDVFHSYLSEYVIKQRLPLFWNPEDKEHRVASSYPELIVNGMNSKLINHINGYLAEISDHKFYKWLQDSNLDPKLKLKSFIPLWIADIMGYRDINKYIFTYKSPASESESIINEYAMYLTEHSRLFYTDWKSLELDDMLRWTASDTLEFIFLNTDMDVHRENIIKFSLYGLKYKDPLIRLWFILILELSGKEFFFSCW